MSMDRLDRSILVSTLLVVALVIALWAALLFVGWRVLSHFGIV